MSWMLQLANVGSSLGIWLGTYVFHRWVRFVPSPDFRVGDC